MPINFRISDLALEPFKLSLVRQDPHSNEPAFRVVPLAQHFPKLYQTDAVRSF
jgi:hypothetical protein